MTKSEIKKFIFTLMDVDSKNTELLSFKFGPLDQIQIKLKDETGIFVFTIGVMKVDRAENTKSKKIKVYLPATF